VIVLDTSCWLDPVQRVTGLTMTQILPFADQRVLQLYGQCESGVYNALKAA
jgi:methyl acetate hydrolase